MSFTNFFLICFLMFTCAHPISSTDDVGNGTEAYIGCQCGSPSTLIERTLDGKMAEDIYDADYPFGRLQILQTFPVYRDIKDCEICTVNYTTCKDGMNYSMCSERTIKFRLLPRQRRDTPYPMTYLLNNSSDLRPGGKSPLSVSFHQSVSTTESSQSPRLHSTAYWSVEDQPRIIVKRSSQNFSRIINSPIDTPYPMPYLLNNILDLRPGGKSPLSVSFLQSVSTTESSQSPRLHSTEYWLVEDEPRIIVKRSSQNFSRIINTPIGGYNDTRVSSRSENCSFPDFLSTAVISCDVQQTFITCTIFCGFGHVIDGSITKVLTCRMRDNEWRPSGFKECTQFVDCHVFHIRSKTKHPALYVGSSNCSSLTLTKKPECQIECPAYKDKEAVPARTYSCGIDGNWDPPLPFCVVAGEGWELDEAPEKKLHDNAPTDY